VRDTLRAWRFELAEGLLAGADRVLDASDALVVEAAAAGLTLPDRLQRAFEGEDGFEVAEAEAAAQHAAVAAIREAGEARPDTASDGRDLVTAIGLIGVDPEARLTEAAQALARGDVNGAFDAAATAEDQWTGAHGVGQGRIVSGSLLIASAGLLIGLLRTRRRAER
jgi:hypothetical protein